MTNNKNHHQRAARIIEMIWKTVSDSMLNAHKKLGAIYLFEWYEMRDENDM